MVLFSHFGVLDYVSLLLGCLLSFSFIVSCYISTLQLWKCA